MAKPTQDPKWVTTDDPANIIEPSAGAKLNGITSGGIWAREHLNWMFNALSKWVDWVRDNVRSNTENDARYIQQSYLPTLRNASNLNTGVVADARLPLGTLSAKGIVQLDHTTTSNSTATAATSSAVRDTWIIAASALKAGTGSTEGRNNTENDARFVQHTEVVNNLTSRDTDKPLSAEQGRVLRVKNEAQDTTLTALSLTNDSQSRLINNRLRRDNNLRDLDDSVSALGNIGIRYGTVSIAGNSSNTYDLGSKVIGATVSKYQNNANNLQDGPSVWWTGTTFRVWNTSSGSATFSYIALVE